MEVDETQAPQDPPPGQHQRHLGGERFWLSRLGTDMVIRNQSIADKTDK